MHKVGAKLVIDVLAAAGEDFNAVVLMCVVACGNHYSEVRGYGFVYDVRGRNGHGHKCRGGCGCAERFTKPLRRFTAHEAVVETDNNICFFVLRLRDLTQGCADSLNIFFCPIVADDSPKSACAEFYVMHVSPTRKRYIKVV